MNCQEEIYQLITRYFTRRYIRIYPSARFYLLAILGLTWGASRDSESLRRFLPFFAIFGEG